MDNKVEFDTKFMDAKIESSLKIDVQKLTHYVEILSGRKCYKSGLIVEIVYFEGGENLLQGV